MKYVATKLQALNSDGVIKPDSDGYFRLLIGALNVENANGHVYVASQQAISVFDKSSLFQRRIKNGNLRGEWGHPKRLPGMTDEEYIDRMFIVDEANTAIHYRSIELDMSFGKNNPVYNNPAMVGIMAELKPSGYKEQEARNMLTNKFENVCFSLRGFTDDVQNGYRLMRSLRQVMTFDLVCEPGVKSSTKWDTAGAKSDIRLAMESLEDYEVSRAMMHMAIERAKLSSLATEDSRELMLSVYNNMAVRNAPRNAFQSVNNSSLIARI